MDILLFKIASVFNFLSEFFAKKAFERKANELRVQQAILNDYRLAGLSFDNELLGRERARRRNKTSGSHRKNRVE